MGPVRSEPRPPPGRVRWITTGAAALALLAGGCADRPPTAPELSPPEAVPPEGPRTFVSPVVSVLGSFSLPAGSSANPLRPGEQPMALRGITFDEPTWVYVRASGMVKYKVIPEMYDYPCGLTCASILPPHGDEGAVGPLGLNGRLKVQVGLGTDERAFAPWELQPVGEDEAEFLWPVQPGYRIWIGRTPLDGHKACISCNPQYPPASWYTVSGGHHVEVQEVIPLQVEPERRGSSVGERVTFRTRSMEGMREYSWYFANATRFTGQTVPECAGQETCTITLPYPGMMRVSAKWKRYRGLITAQSPVAGICTPELPSLLGADGPRLSAAGTEDECAPEEPEPTAELQCSPAPLERGREVECILRVTPDLSFTVVRQVADRHKAGTIREEINASYTAGQSHVWKGIAVTRTSVQMRVVVTRQNGTTKTLNAQARFDVDPRTWPDPTLQVPTTVHYGFPTGTEMLAYPTDGRVGESRAENPVQYYTTVPLGRGTGPNGGIVFIAEPLLQAPWEAWLHPGFQAVPAGVHPGHPDFEPWHKWHLDQNGVPNGTCPAGMLSQFEIEVRRHEGAASGASHREVANKYYQDRDFGAYLERFFTVETNDDKIREEAWLHWQKFHESAGLKNAQKQFDSADYQAVLASFGCAFDFKPWNP